VALTFLIVLWIFPVVAVQSLANLQTLANVEYLSWLQRTLPPFATLMCMQSLSSQRTASHIQRMPRTAIIDVMNDISPQILAVVEGFLPSLVLLIFISITKPIIELLYSHQGESSYSRIEWITMATYWGFLIFNVFLVSTLGGAFLKVTLTAMTLTTTAQHAHTRAHARTPRSANSTHTCVGDARLCGYDRSWTTSSRIRAPSSICWPRRCRSRAASSSTTF
jgi:hypothetical protein